RAMNFVLAALAGKTGPFLKDSEMSFLIRRVFAHDADALAHVLVTANNANYRGIVPDQCLTFTEVESAAKWKQKLAQPLPPDDCFYVAEFDGGVIGYAWGGWSDRHFYLEIVREFGHPVLDVGCGTGRILLDFLQLGIDIDGVDNSPEMLAICRERAAKLVLAPVLHQQEMESLDLPRQYRTIL